LFLKVELNFVGELVPKVKLALQNKIDWSQIELEAVKFKLFGEVKPESLEKLKQLLQKLNENENQIEELKKVIENQELIGVNAMIDSFEVAMSSSTSEDLSKSVDVVMKCNEFLKKNKANPTIKLHNDYCDAEKRLNELQTRIRNQPNEEIKKERDEARKKLVEIGNEVMKLNNDELEAAVNELNEKMKEIESLGIGEECEEISIDESLKEFDEWKSQRDTAMEQLKQNATKLFCDGGNDICELGNTMKLNSKLDFSRFYFLFFIF
jgi:hypothetical protein